MTNAPYIIAEVAQGYEGDTGVARLLTRAAKAGGADAVKFQMVWAEDLCEIGYQYYDLFKQLEMPESDWRVVVDYCHTLGLDFVADIFGSRALEICSRIAVDAYKIHSTGFFDDALVTAVLALDKPVYLSVGGIESDEILTFIERHDLKDRKNVVILYGYQAEPTPIEGNNLARIETLRQLTRLEVGFMDHSDGDGIFWLTLSAMALGLGVRVFEKHITLERQLEMEDYVSALEPTRFRAYVDQLRSLETACGSPTLNLSEAERGYRSRAVKRVVAARDLPAGHVLAAADLRLSRPAESRGVYKLEQVAGRTLRVALSAGQPVDESELLS